MGRIFNLAMCESGIGCFNNGIDQDCVMNYTINTHD